MKAIILEVFKMHPRKKILILTKNWFFWMKNNKSREDKFGKTRTELGLISKHQRSKEEKHRAKENRKRRRRLIKLQVHSKL